MKPDRKRESSLNSHYIEIIVNVKYFSLRASVKRKGYIEIFVLFFFF